MKKRFLALLTVLLVATLMTTAVFASTSLVIDSSVDTSTALKEGDTFDVYIVVGPMNFTSTGTKPTASSQWIYRIAEDSANAKKNPLAANQNTKDEKFTVKWDNTTLEVLSVSHYNGSPSDTDQEAGDGYKFAYLAQTSAKAVAPNVTGVGTGAANTGTLVIDYGTEKAAGFFIRKEAIEPKAAVAKVTFKVVTGAKGGDMTITLDNTYTYIPTNTAGSNAQTSVSVEVAKGCAHENMAPIADGDLAAKGLENADSTCLVAGHTWYYCSDCKTDIKVDLNKLDHDYSVEKYIGEAESCTKDAQKAMFCSTDGCTEYDKNTVTTVEKLGHSYTQSAYKEPDCDNAGYHFYYCDRCGAMSANGKDVVAGAYYIDGKLYKESTAVTPLDEMPLAVHVAKLGHAWVYDRTEGDAVYYACSRKDECGVEDTVFTSEHTVRYVANEATGKKDGSSVENATTLIGAFDDFKELPEGLEATIYLVGTVNVPKFRVSESNTVEKSFEEYPHAAHITVTTAPGEAKAALHFAFNTSSHYYLYGPTTFDNVIFSSDAKGTSSGSSDSISLFARGFRFETTENVEMKSTLTGTDAVIKSEKLDGNFMYAQPVSFEFAACKFYLSGGFYKSSTAQGLYDDHAGITYESNLVLNGGEFWVVAGGGRNNTNLPILNSTLNITVGGKVLINSLIPVTIHSGEVSLNGTVVNIYYHGGKIVNAYRADSSDRVNTTYTVNHFFFNGSEKMVIGDFMMGNKQEKQVNCYYSIRFTSVPSTKDFALGFIAKGDQYIGKYGETHENLSFAEYCLKYLGGHKFVDGACEFCELPACATSETHNFANEEYAEATCVVEGYKYYWCADCNVVSSTTDALDILVGVYCVDGKLCFDPDGTNELSEIPNDLLISTLGHDWVFDRKSGDTLYYRCSREAECGVAEWKITKADTIRYVAKQKAGTGTGVTAANAMTYVEASKYMSQFPEGVDATIYLTEDVTLSKVHVSKTNNFDKSFEEYPHKAHITVTTAPGAEKAAIYFPFATVSQYYLYGDVTFDNVFFSSNAKGTTSSSSDSISIFARGFRFETTENVEMKSTLTGDDATYKVSKTGGNFEYNVDIKDYPMPACKIYLCGGFYGSESAQGLYDGHDGETYESNLVINGGTFHVVSGGGRNNAGVPIINSTLNISVGGNAVIYSLNPISIHSTVFDVTGTVANIHYYGGTVLQAYRSESSARNNNQYTVNHFFHNGCGTMKIGDFLMGDAHEKQVNCYYSVSDTATVGADEFGLGFIAKGNSYAEKYGETNENKTFVEYCALYLGGHNFVNDKCTFCDIVVNASHSHTLEMYIAAEPTCIAPGEKYQRCTVCFEKVGDSIYEPAASETLHVKEWTISADNTTLTCACVVCGKTFNTVANNNLTCIYVSDNGTPEGGFSADKPTSDLEAAFEIAAASGKDDFVIYVVGAITAPRNCVLSTDYYAFAEPAHENSIIVAGYTDQAVLKLCAPGYEAKKIVYALNGDTTFKNIEFSSWGNTMAEGKTDIYSYIAAQHNHLTFGEKVTLDFMRNTSANRNSGSYIILGGCYSVTHHQGKAVAVSKCTGGDNHVTFYSGSFFRFIGGSVTSTANDNCKNANVKVEVLGDVTVRGYFALGSYEKTAGNVHFTLDGNLSVGNYFSFAGVNTEDKFETKDGAEVRTDRINNANVGDVVFKVVSGSISSYSFAGSSELVVTPLGSSPYGYRASKGADPDYNVTRHLKSLTVVYNPAEYTSVETAFRLKSVPVESNKIKFEAVLASDACAMTASGLHVKGTLKGAKASDCVTQGFDTYECTECKKNFTVMRDIKQHEFGTATTFTAATCGKNEVLVQTCKNCNYVEYIEGASASGAHTYVNEVCTGCDGHIHDIENHNTWVVVNAAYVTGCGVGKQEKCSACSKERITITGEDHNYSKFTVTVQPTETEPGVKTRSCRSCGKVETALIYANGGAINSTAIATDANGNLANLDVATSKLKKAERNVLNALIQDCAYGSEVKVSYKVDGEKVTDITYSIPLPAEYADLKNVKVVVKDDDGTLHTVEFAVEKGYIVFKF